MVMLVGLARLATQQQIEKASPVYVRVVGHLRVGGYVVLLDHLHVPLGVRREEVLIQLWALRKGLRTMAAASARQRGCNVCRPTLEKEKASGITSFFCPGCFGSSTYTHSPTARGSDLFAYGVSCAHVPVCAPNERPVWFFSQPKPCSKRCQRCHE